MNSRKCIYITGIRYGSYLAETLTVLLSQIGNDQIYGIHERDHLRHICQY